MCLNELMKITWNQLASCKYKVNITSEDVIKIWNKRAIAKNCNKTNSYLEMAIPNLPNDYTNQHFLPC